MAHSETSLADAVGTRKLDLGRLLFASAMVACLSASVIFAGLNAAQATTQNLVMAGIKVLYFAPLFVAMDKGLLAEQSINLTFRDIDSGSLGPAAVISGNAQLTDVEVKQVADLHARGKSLIMFYNLVNRTTLDMVVRNDVLAKRNFDPSMSLDQKLKLLKRLTFGITRPGSPSDGYPRYLLIRAGFDPNKDATFVQIGGVTALEAAFRSGRIDAFIQSPPLPQKLDRSGVGTIIVRNTLGEVPELDNSNTVSFATTDAFAKANPETIKGFSKVLIQATKWLKENPDEGTKMLAAKWFPDTNIHDLRAALAATLPALSDTGVLTEESLQRNLHVADVLGENVKADLAEGVLWTSAYVKP